MGHRVLGAAALAAGAALAVLLAPALPAAGDGLPLPQATSASVTVAPTGSTTASASATGSRSPSPVESEVEPTDDPSDDGTDPAPDQTSTWVALGGAAAVALLAGLVVVLRRR